MKIRLPWRSHARRPWRFFRAPCRSTAFLRSSSGRFSTLVRLFISVHRVVTVRNLHVHCAWNHCADGVLFCTSYNQSADSTSWPGFLMVFNYYSWYCVNANRLPTPTFYFMHECQNLLIQCSTSGFFVNFNSLNLLLFVMNNRNGPTYIGIVHQNFQCFDISRGLGDLMRLRLITERDRELVPHVCCYQMIK